MSSHAVLRAPKFDLREKCVLGGNILCRRFEGGNEKMVRVYVKSEKFGGP